MKLKKFFKRNWDLISAATLSLISIMIGTKTDVFYYLAFFSLIFNVIAIIRNFKLKKTLWRWIVLIPFILSWIFVIFVFATIGPISNIGTI